MRARSRSVGRLFLNGLEKRHEPSEDGVPSKIVLVTLIAHPSDDLSQENLSLWDSPIVTIEVAYSRWARESTFFLGICQAYFELDPFLRSRGLTIKSHGHMAQNRLVILPKILIDFGKSRQYTATQDILKSATCGGFQRVNCRIP